MPDLSAIITIALFVGSTVFGLQLADAVLSVIDARTVRDEDEPDQLTRRRVRELFWTVAVTAALAVIVAFAVDSAARLVWDENRPVVGAVVLIASAAVAFIIGLIAVFAVVRRERPTYARIRRDLRDRESFVLDATELAGFEERLEQADRARGRRSRLGGVLRIIGLVVVLVLAVLVVIVGSVGGDLRLVIGFGVAGLVSIVAFVVAARASAVRRNALESVLDAQRAEVDAMLERARIPQRGTVPGLRERVSRALSILREQQR